MNYPGLHTAPISNMVGTEELILLHSVSKATLPTQNQRQYAQLQILRHWCKFFLTNWSTRLYDYLLAISQAIELYRLALFSLLFFFLLITPTFHHIVACRRIFTCCFLISHDNFLKFILVLCLKGMISVCLSSLFSSLLKKCFETERRAVRKTCRKPASVLAAVGTTCLHSFHLC